MIDARTAGGYILAQLVGAVVAAAFLSGIYPAAAASAVSLGTPLLAEAGVAS